MSIKKQQLIEKFSEKETISLRDIDAFYRESEPEISKTSVSWRVYSLVQDGALQRIGHGLYKIGTTKPFLPVVSPKMKQINKYLKSNFPYIQFCIWDLSFMNQFANHLINYNVLFADVEKDVMESAYYVLKESFSKVIQVGDLYDDLSEFKDWIIIRSLTSRAPIQKIDNVTLPSLEKTLVDLYSDKEFTPFQGKELLTIFSSAFEQYTINENTMLRYAERKNRRNEIEDIIQSIKR